MITTIQSESGNEYTIDTENITCSCPNFRYRCSHFSQFDEKRLCKHLSGFFEDHPELMPIQLQKVLTPNEPTPSTDGKVRYPRSLFDSYVAGIKSLLWQFNEVEQFEICGSYRRRCEMVSDLDVLFTLASGYTVDPIFDYAEQILGYSKQWRGDLKAGYLIDGFVHVDFKLVPKESWYYALMHFTGSKYENIALRTQASRLGYKLNEYGLYKADTEELVSTKVQSEKDVYQLLNLTYKEPWER